MEKVTRIDLLRHGETTAGSCFLGSTDAPLSQLGWRQLQASIKKENYQHIVSSPLSRCLDFAQLYSQESGLPISIENDFREMSFGDWEAKTTEEIWQTQQDDLKAFWDDPVKNTPPAAEEFTVFKNRINSAFQKIIKEHKTKQILVIAHGGVIRQIIADILSVSVNKSQQIRFDHAGLSRVDCYDESRSLRFINRQVEVL